MKKILFNLTPVTWQANGSAVYIQFVFKALLSQGHTNVHAFYLGSEQIDDALESLISQKESSFFRCKDNHQVEALIKKEQYDAVYFGNLSNTDIRVPVEISMIVTIHDLRFIEISNDATRHYYYSSYFKRFKQRLSFFLNLKLDKKRQLKEISKFINHPKLEIVTVSEHTRYSIKKHYPFIPESKLHVFYCPFPQANNDQVNIESGLGDVALANQSFFLILSSDRWFKNAYRAIKALDELISKNQLKDKKVLVLGDQKSVLQQNTKLKNPERFMFQGYVENQILQFYFKNAFCLLYPSLQEGFGIPPLEAMKYGTPVVASSNTAIPEICGNGALYFNPYLVVEIQNRVLQLLDDQELYQTMKQRALENHCLVSKRQKTDFKNLLTLLGS